jgi:hypothetical protein
MQLENIAGKRFGHWEVLSRAPNRGKTTMWLCLCDCGKIKPVSVINLKSGKSTNCGCLRIRATIAASTKHGMANTRLYGVWKDMRSRCYTKTASDYKYYGGRGVSICEEWGDFSKFQKWAMSHGYVETAKYGDCTIDRIDVNGNYEPNNCRWADMKTQRANQRNSKKEKCLCQTN